MLGVLSDSTEVKNKNIRRLTDYRTKMMGWMIAFTTLGLVVIVTAQPTNGIQNIDDDISDNDDLELLLDDTDPLVNKLIQLFLDHEQTYDTDDDPFQRSIRGNLLRYGKRGALFRYGKRQSFMRYGKRGGLFRFGKRASSGSTAGKRIFRWGKRSEETAEKRGNLMRWGKRAGDSDFNTENEIADDLSMRATSKHVERDDKLHVPFRFGRDESEEQ
ncbi:unnamed protein product [Owenia fusiformis]|uniref:Uncharacterized protein n=1 Tax=Owenia fusiformis TaxID=6347 RepID=A0A8S4MVT5_OWEFU|nr:unnamed protein product [Owenia fusiformis]